MAKYRRKPISGRSTKKSPAIPRRRLLSALVAQALCIPLAAQAASIEVTSTDDDGTGCTLREAVVSVNDADVGATGCVATGPGFGNSDEITFDGSVAGSTITLTGGQIYVDESVSINPGGTETTIDAGNSSRIFRIDPANIQVYMENLVLTNGNGGAIYVSGSSTTLGLTSCTITGNTAGVSSGGISIDGSAVTLESSTVSDNTSPGAGGGIRILNSASVYLSNSEISGNSAGSAGGGIYVDNSTLVVSNNTVRNNLAHDSGGGISGENSANVELHGSTISGNRLTGSGGRNGGGISFQNNVSASLFNSTVESNYAPYSGGIFVTEYSNVSLTNSTVSGNTANEAGGIRTSNNSSLTLTNSTIADNTASGALGVQLVFSSSGYFYNSIIADSYGGGFGCAVGDGASVVAGADNIIEDDGCTTSAIDTDPGLDRLALNGGLTRTHALLTGSAAIDAGDNTDCGTGQTVALDQRGAARNDGSCDIGAYEVVGTPGSIEVTSDLDDNGAGCTLREAITSVNTGSLATGCLNTGGSLATPYTVDEITFNGSLYNSTIVLANGPLQIDASVVMNRSGLPVTVSATSGSRVVEVDNSDTRVDLHRMNLTQGNAGGYDGGAVLVSNFSDLLLASSTVSDSTTGDDGGGVAVINNSRLILADTTISGNSASDNGGGVFATVYSSVSLSNSSLVTGNYAGNNSGGINLYRSSMTLNDSTVTGNTANGTNGGGVGVFYYSILDVRNGTISANSAYSFGGGIGGNLGKTFIVDSSISGNTAGIDCGGINGYQSNVVLQGATVSNNVATRYGGGICGTGATLELSNTTVSGNSVSDDDGGGIIAGNGALVTIESSTISGNTVSGNTADGAGILVGSGTNLQINRSVLSGNVGSGVYTDGGGLTAFSSTTTITQSTISGNSVVDDGGGLYIYGGTASVVNSSISGNIADDSAAGVGAFSNTSVTITNSTISGNTAPTSAGLLSYQYDSNSPTVTLSNTIMGNSYSGSDCGTDGTVTFSASFTLVENDNCGLTDSVDGNIIGTDPQIGPLADNGGATPTHLLIPGGPAIDSGDNTDCGTGQFVETDQRGALRNDGSCDIGAFEANAIEMDLGDAPDAPYPTLLASDGARHQSVGLTLGSGRDTEDDGQPTGAADGDDTNGADEDGVGFGTDLETGNAITVTVNVSADGLLDAWVDFNADGDWEDAGEQIFVSQAVNTGNNVLDITTPFDASEGTTFGRFRVSADGGLSPTGYEDNGEVEDYQITIVNGDSDEDGMPDDYEEDNGLNPDVNDAGEDEDGDGINNLDEYNAGLLAGDPDTDGDGIGDALDNEPLVGSNQCNSDPATLSSLNVPDGDTLQCAANTSIEVQSGVGIQSGGRLELISPVVTFGDGFTVPTGAELNVDSTDPVPSN